MTNSTRAGARRSSASGGKGNWPGLCNRLPPTGVPEWGDIVSTNAPANKTVVVAEDYPDISQLVGDILREEGYDVRIVSRGAEVMPAILKYHPSLLLLDLSLPDMPGNDVLQQLELSPETCSIPVIIVSAYTDTLRRVPQVRAVVNKPFDITTLLDAVEQVRTGHRMRA